MKLKKALSNLLILGLLSLVINLNPQKVIRLRSGKQATTIDSIKINIDSIKLELDSLKYYLSILLNDTIK